MSSWSGGWRDLVLTVEDVPPAAREIGTKDPGVGIAVAGSAMS
jgi:hypothetical protein